MSKERGENKVGEKMPHLDERWVNYRLKDADFGDVFEFGEMVEEFSQRVTILNTFINILLAGCGQSDRRVGKTRLYAVEGSGNHCRDKSRVSVRNQTRQMNIPIYIIIILFKYLAH